MLKQTSHARWHNHINHVQAPPRLRHWLIDRGSLTFKLIAHSSKFRVQRIYQQHDFCWADEYEAIGLTKVSKVHARDVVLHCNDMPVIYAHTVLPLNSNAKQWPRFKSLGEKSLGSTLFNDPKVKRSTLQFARLPLNHPAMRGVQRFIQYELKQGLFARRSLFFRCRGTMLVTEVFLPTILELKANSSPPLVGEGVKHTALFLKEDH